MSDYIKRSDALIILKGLNGEHIRITGKPSQKIKDAINTIKYLPAADVVERKKGEWVGYPDSFKYEHVYDRDAIVCPFCEESWNIVDNDTERFNFCPNCGADMRESPKEEDT